MISDIFLFTTS